MECYISKILNKTRKYSWVTNYLKKKQRRYLCTQDIIYQYEYIPESGIFLFFIQLINGHNFLS